jgi:two-component system, sensor histidine kinase and response regulator
MELGQFLTQQLDYVFFFYGLAFILLAAVCTVLPERPERRLPWVWLGLFGLAHGVNEWLDMLALSLGDTLVFSLLRLAVMGLSFVFLFEFGRKGVRVLEERGPGGWIVLPLLVGAFSGYWLAGVSGLNAATRYSLGFFGGIMASWALFLASKREAKPSYYLKAAAVAMALYALAAGAIVPQASFYPALLFNHAWFLSSTGIPIQLVRGLLAVLITAMIWEYCQKCNREVLTESKWDDGEFYGLRLTLLVGFILVAGWIATEYVGKHVVQELSSEMLKQTRIAAAAVNPDRLQHLTGTEADLGHPDYIRLREQLMSMRRANPAIHRLYLMSLKAGAIWFAMDSIPEVEPGHILPGMAYEQPPKELLDVFTTGQSVAVGPYSNVFGSFVSGFAPIQDFSTTKIVAVLGVDSDQSFVHQKVAKVRVALIGITLLICLLMFGFFVIRQRLWDSARRTALNEERLVEAQQLAHLGSWAYYPKSNEITWSQEMFRIFGCDPNQHVPSYLEQQKPIHPEDWPKLDKAILDSVREAKGYEMDLRLIRPDGSIRHIHSVAQVKQAKNGEVVQLQGTSQDVTEQKLIEQALRYSEERYRTLISNIPIGLYRITPGREGRFVMVNPTIVKMFGYESSEELLNADVASMYGDEEERRQFAGGLLAEDQISGWDLLLKRKDGSLFWGRITVQVVRDATGQLEYFDGMIEDVTERRRIREALRESQQYLSDVIEFLPDATLVIDREGRVTAWNRAMEELTEVRAKDMLGKGNYEYALPFYGERRPLLIDLSMKPADEVETLYSNVERRGETLTGEAIIPDRGGGRLYLYGSATALRNSRGEIVGAIESIRDITMRKRAEEDLASTNEQLELAIAQANEMALQAEMANMAKSEFLANMSHEIRTPMNAIVGLSYLALKTRLTDQQRGYLNKIQNSAHNLLGLINDILDFSKIEAGRLEVETTSFSLDQVFYNVASVVSVKGEEKGIEIYFRKAPDVPLELVGDPLRLGQVLLNLVGNAIKFTETGEIVISTELVSRETDAAVLRFSVRDTGIGMNEAQQARLFQPFTQADGSTTRKFGGTGLGLAISKQLVELMGGEISVESIPAMGSTFTFTLAVGIEAEENIQSHTVPVDLRGLKVLIADDNQTELEIMETTLAALSFEVTSVDSGMAALKELEVPKKDYDLVLLDWRMPGMDGIETARRIKAHPHLQKPPKVFLITAYGREEVMVQAKELGLEGFMVKPISDSVLFDTIMEAFGRERHGLAEGVSVNGKKAAEASTLAGSRLLLVEDNEINQQVAQGILESFGVVVEIASNGRQATEMLTEGAARFDAVLMDLQMPEMDGYEATRFIRKHLNNTNLPIIACTAHALKTEQQRCLDAGMNDYVSKPIDPEHLLTTLGRWIKPAAGQVSAPAVPDKDAAEGLPELPDSLPGIDVKNALKRLMGNRGLFIRLVADLCREYAGVTGHVREALAREDTESARRTAHTLKGIAGNLSATEIFEVARDLETAVQQGDQTTISESLDRLDDALKTVIQTARRLKEMEVEAPEPAPHIEEPTAPKAEIAILLMQLYNLLKKNSLSARKQFGLLKQRLKTDDRSEPLLEELEACLARLDFKGARTHLSAIAQRLDIAMP